MKVSFFLLSRKSSVNYTYANTFPSGNGKNFQIGYLLLIALAAIICSYESNEVNEIIKLIMDMF